MKPEITVYSKRDLVSELMEELEKWSQKEFGHLPYQWAWATLGWYILARKDLRLIGSLGILRRTVSVGLQRVEVGGIGGIITHPQWRHRGVASALLREAVGFIQRDLGCKFGLLLCRRETVPLYRNVGWKQAQGPTRFSQPSGKQTYPGATMVYQCGEKPWPPGPIDLCGLPW